MPPRASRTISRDHHSPIVSSERATGHRLALKDLCRIAPRSQSPETVVAPLYQIRASYQWLHHATRLEEGWSLVQELELKRSKTMTYKPNIRRITLGLLPIIALVFAGALAATSQTSAPRNVKNMVLIHGGFVDGSGWEGVYNILKKKGYNITIVQNPTISLADDVAVTKRVIAAQDGPVVLVGHSYGGVVITEAGTDPKVVGLVYVAAFAPDRGESVETLI